MYPAEKPWITFNIFKIYSHWTDFPICCISMFCAGHPSHLRCVSSNITSVSIVKTKEIPEIQIQSFYFEILPSDMFPAEVYLTWRSAGPPQHPGGDWSVKRGLTSCSLWGECRYCGGGCLRIMNHSPRLSVWAVRRWSAPLCLQWGLFQG